MGEFKEPSPLPDLLPQDLLPVSEDLIPRRQNMVPTIASVSFDRLLEKPLLLREDPKDGCGGYIWPAGMQLSKYMLRKHRTDLKGKTIVELGAGSGLVGLAVAQGCDLDSPIYITDQIPMLPLIQENIQLNKLFDRPIHASVLDWGDIQALRSFPQPAVILAADCVYFEPAFPLLLQTLQELIGDETVCYFCFKKRRKADSRFLRQAKKKFDMTPITDDIDSEFCQRESIYLYTIRKRRQPSSADTVKKTKEHNGIDIA